MAFPTDLTNAVDGVTEIVAAHLNNLEAKVGVDGSTVATSLDYLLKNAASINPGHKHSKLFASDGDPEAVTVDADGRVGIGTTSPDVGFSVAKTSTLIGQDVESGEIELNIGYEVGAGKAFCIGYDISGNMSRLRVRGDAGSLGLTIASNSNIGIGQTSFGTSALRVLGIGNGTAPTTSPSDMFQMWSADQAAGNACPHFRTENGTVLKLYQQAHIDAPSGGTTVDAEARTAINSILDLLENLGLMAAS